MALTQRLDLRQSQTLVMTPQLQQAIKLLQMSNLELTAYVESELEQNPLLERDEGGALAEEGPDRGGESGEPSSLVDGGETSPDHDNLWTNDGPSDGIAPSDGSLTDWRGGGAPAEDGPSLENTLSSGISLRDHLLGQLNVEVEDRVERMIGVLLIDMLDEAGYLPADLSSVAERLGCELSRVEATLECLQRFDPTGIFARDLAECLALQLRERDRLDPAMQALLEHLDLLAKRDAAALMRVCGVDADDLQDMAAELKSLDPKPATAFDQAPAQPVTPDLIMSPQPGGKWLVELNNDTLPRVLVNTRYYAEVSAKVSSRATRDYLSEHFQAANWLVRSLHQRATTILKVATEIVRQQEGFFAHGVHRLKPLVLKDIAQSIAMHESTVSRVTANKYMVTPRGMFELKYFFTSAIASAGGGDAHSAEAVRSRIRTLVDQESPDDVLADDRIVLILRQDGIDIARRTVAKYREAMKIPSSVERRRRKAACIPL
ncbi:MAG: RNA polymerase factor sigma-54 [Alphaproteobacteria bacterium]